MELSSRQKPVQLLSLHQNGKSHFGILWLISSLFGFQDSVSRVSREARTDEFLHLPHLANLRFSRASRDTREQLPVQTPLPQHSGPLTWLPWGRDGHSTWKQLRNRAIWINFGQIFPMRVCEQTTHRCEFVQFTMFTWHFLPFTAACEQLHELSQPGLDKSTCPKSVVRLSNQQWGINSECQGEELACEGPGSVEWHKYVYFHLLETWHVIF